MDHYGDPLNDEAFADREFFEFGLQPEQDPFAALDEADPFLGKALRGAARLVRRAAPILKRLAPIAARAIAGAVPGGSIAAGLLGEEEDEAWLEQETVDPLDEEAAYGPSPEAEAESAVLAEALLARAGQVASDTEAAALAGGITITITGPAPLVVRRVAPIITSGSSTLVRALRQRPETRPLTPLVGTIARRTVNTLARGAAAGRQVTPAAAARVMAGHTRAVLGRPQTVTRAVARSAMVRQRMNPRAIARAEG